MDIVIASKNKGKVKEIKAFFEDALDINWLTFEDFSSFPDIKESGSSFLENAKLKAKAISEYTCILTLADDSGLIVDALGGRPGVKSSRYAGDGATDKDNRVKLLNELNGIYGKKKRTARFVCSMILWDPKKGFVFKSSGICEGHIGVVEKGVYGFGYDSIFIPAGFKRTMAQLSQSEKNKISHRGKALMGIKKFLLAK